MFLAKYSYFFQNSIRFEALAPRRVSELTKHEAFHHSNIPPHHVKRFLRPNRMTARCVAEILMWWARGWPSDDLPSRELMSIVKECVIPDETWDDATFRDLRRKHGDMVDSVFPATLATNAVSKRIKKCVKCA